MIAQQRIAGRNIELLRQAAEILARIDDRQYAERPARQAGAGIGGHLRHCLDFYRCFLRGVEGARIDYDRRELQFLLSHTVHHHALIAALLRGHGIEPPADFGFVPSTLRYLREI